MSKIAFINFIGVPKELCSNGESGEPNVVLFERRGRDSHELELARCVIGFYGARLDDDGCVTPLVVLALVRNRPRHVTTRHHYTRHNDCHD